MKLIFIIHSLDKVGGAETILVRLINYFSSVLNHEIILIILSNKNIIFEIDSQIHIEQYNGTSNGLKNTLKQVQYIKNMIQEHKPNLIISFITTTNILATIAAKLSHTPIIISERSNYNYGVNGKTWSFLRRTIYPFANLLILPSKEEIERYYYSQHIKIIPNPLKLQEKTKSIQKEKLILAVGTLHHVKGFDMLIDAFHQSDYKEWKVIILGEGLLRDKLEVQIEKLGLKDSVSLLGYKKDTELYYKKASIFILSSRAEGYPNVLCEAMSNGCASIAFDCVSGPKEIITNEKDGILVPPEDVKMLSSAISKLINEDKLREKLAQNATKISSKLNIKVICSIWEASIQEIINKKIVRKR